MNNKIIPFPFLSPRAKFNSMNTTDHNETECQCEFCGRDLRENELSACDDCRAAAMTLVPGTDVDQPQWFEDVATRIY